MNKKESEVILFDEEFGNFEIHEITTDTEVFAAALASPRSPAAAC